MFDMSWGEVMVIGGVALIVIGPKDLPKALRTVGQMTSKVKRLAYEFQSQFNDAMREADLADVKREVEGLNRDVARATSSTINPIQTIRDELKTSIESKNPAAVGAEPVAYAPADHAALDAASMVDAAPVPVVEEAGPVPQIEPAPAADPGHPHSVSPAPAPMEPAGPGLEPGPAPEHPPSVQDARA